MSRIEKENHYDAAFFDRQVDGAVRSARLIAPLVLEMATVASVVDLGCGRGAWLAAFEELGVADVLGFDGDYVDRSRLLVDPAKFRPADLRLRVESGRRFDLAICLEVGEHLPSKASRTLVESLIQTAPLILFSAALPGQGGTGHLNEQWPDYWERRFAAWGYRRLDLVRPRIWQDRRIDWWYRQNIYLYADVPTSIELGRSFAIGASTNSGMELIREEVLGRYKSFRGLLGETARAGIRALHNRMAR